MHAPAARLPGLAIDLDGSVEKRSRPADLAGGLSAPPRHLGAAETNGSLAIYPPRVRSNEMLGGTYLDQFALGVRPGNRPARLPQRLDMQLYGFANELAYFATRFPSGYTSRKIGDMRPVTGFSFFTTTRYSITSS